MLAPDQANTHELQAGVSTTPLPRRSWRDNNVVACDCHSRACRQWACARKLCFAAQPLSFVSHFRSPSSFEFLFASVRLHHPLRPHTALINRIQSCTTRSRVAKTRSQLGHYGISVGGDHCQAFPRRMRPYSQSESAVAGYSQHLARFACRLRAKEV
jgi:hypothetical protein